MTAPPAMYGPSPIIHHSSSKADDGISSSISAVLIVALVVILVGISASAFMGFAASPNTAPVLGISISMKGDTVLVSHLNGAVLPAGTYAVLIDGVDRTQMFTPPGDFGPGTTLTSSSMTGVGTVSVISKEGGGSMLLALKSFGGEKDLGTLVIGGTPYQLKNYLGTLEELKEFVKNGEISDSKGAILIDDDEYYWMHRWKNNINCYILDNYEYNFIKLNADEVKILDGTKKTYNSGDLILLDNKLYVVRPEHDTLEIYLGNYKDNVNWGYLIPIT